MSNLTVKNWLSVLMLLVLVVIIGAYCFISQGQTEDIDSSLEKRPMSFLTKRKEIVEIFMVGDIMLDRGVEYMVEKEGKGDFRFPFLKIGEELKTADLLIGNLEGPLSDKGSDVGSIYSFRMDPKAMDGLKYAGFDIMLISNNHAFDYGKEALEDTLKRLKNEEMSYVGAGFDEKEAFSPLVKELRGIKIAFLDYTNLGSGNWIAGENSSGIAWVSDDDMEKVKENIGKAKEQADFLIVFLHAGNEYQKEPSSFQVSFAEAAIDSGADLVVEHHPHVVQKSQEYKGKKIFYSLGNFIFDQGFSNETMAGQILKVSLYKSSSTATVKEISSEEITLNRFFQPEPRKD